MTAARKGKRKRGKPGPPSDEELIRRALRRPLTVQIERTAKAVFARVELHVSKGEGVPISLLGIARMFSEWHTDYLTVDQPVAGSETPRPPPPVSRDAQASSSADEERVEPRASTAAQRDTSRLPADATDGRG